MATGNNNKHTVGLDLESDPSGRLLAGIQAKETILVLSPPLWERIELVDFLANSIPKTSRVIVLEDGSSYDPKLRESVLPTNHVILNYKVSGNSTAQLSLAKIAGVALRLRSDYLIIPSLQYSDVEEFQQHIAHAFEGLIVASSAHDEDINFISIADILVKVGRRTGKSLGIKEVWARPATSGFNNIPVQSAGPHFTLNMMGQISQVSSATFDADGNDIRRIRQLLPLVRETADDLAARINHESNAFSELARILQRYREAISQQEAEISWGLVWGFGLRLEDTAEATERSISNRLGPTLEDAALAALQSLRTLHAPLILASREGRELQEQADRMRMTHAEQLTFQEDTLFLSASLKEAESIRESDVSQLFEEVAKNIGHGSHPERNTVFGIATVKNLAIIIFGAWVVSAPAQYLGGAAEPAVIMAAWEAMKKSPMFSSAAAAIGLDLEALMKLSQNELECYLNKLVSFRQFLQTVEPYLRRIAASTPQLRWMLTSFDRVVKKGSSPE